MARHSKPLRSSSATSINFQKLFLNHNFARPIDMHATYFSMYIALGCNVRYDYAFIKTEIRVNKYLYAFISIVLMAGLIQLSSRAVLISFALIINLLVPNFWIEKTKRTVYLILSLLITLSVVLVLQKTTT
jgi:O-antigen ligase